jgi:hypothetical protein
MEERFNLYIEMIEANAFRTFIRIYSLLKSERERLSTNFKLSLHKTLIRNIMTYACPEWEFAADILVLKLDVLYICVSPWCCDSNTVAVLPELKNVLTEEER